MLAGGVSVDESDFQRGWASGLPETPCGSGSTLEATRLQRKVLARWVEQHRIHSIVDVGAGDMNWVRYMEWPHPVHYEPLDLVPRTPAVRQFDLINEVPPRCDMVWCLWLLNHLPDHQSAAALKNLLATECRYIVYTWWPGMADFLDLYPIEHVTILPRKEAELRLLKC